MKYMLDANICIYLMNECPKHYYKKLALLEEQQHQVGISAIVHSELQYGVAASNQQTQNQLKLAVLLSHLTVFPYTEACSFYYGQLRAELKNRGCLIGANDLFIAAHALAEQAILVTNNTREFNRIAELQLENWPR